MEKFPTRATATPEWWSTASRTRCRRIWKRPSSTLRSTSIQQRQCNILFLLFLKALSCGNLSPPCWIDPSSSKGLRVGAHVLVSQREPHAGQGRRLREGPRKEQNVRSARNITFYLIFPSSSAQCFLGCVWHSMMKGQNQRSLVRKMWKVMRLVDIRCDRSQTSAWFYLTSTLFQIPKCGRRNDGSVERISADAKLPEGSRRKLLMIRRPTLDPWI